MKQIDTTTPKNGYKVTPEAAAILNCLRETGELYHHICEAVKPLHPSVPNVNEDAEEKATAPYLELINKIDMRLHSELTRRVIDSLSDLKNISNPDTITL